MDMELLPRGTIARFFAPGEDPLKAHAVRVKGSLCLEPDCGDSTRSPKRQHGWTCVADDPSAPLWQAPRHLRNFDDEVVDSIIRGDARAIARGTRQRVRVSKGVYVEYLVPRGTQKTYFYESPLDEA